MLRKWLQLSPAPAEGGDAPQTADQINQPQTGKVDLPPPQDNAPPPVAKTALEGKRTERELELERRLKAAEMDNASLQDKHRTEAERAKALEEELKRRDLPPPPPATPEQEEERWGFFKRSTQG